MADCGKFKSMVKSCQLNDLSGTKASGTFKLEPFSLITDNSAIFCQKFQIFKTFSLIKKSYLYKYMGFTACQAEQPS